MKYRIVFAEVSAAMKHGLIQAGSLKPSRKVYHYKYRSSGEALASDWIKVGAGLRRASSKVKKLERAG